MNDEWSYRNKTQLLKKNACDHFLQPLCVFCSWAWWPTAAIALSLQAHAQPPSPGENAVGASAPAAVRTGPGPAAPGGPAAAPAIPGEAQTTVPTAAAAAHHQQGISTRVCAQYQK